MASEILNDLVQLPENQIHYISTDVKLELAVDHYERLLHQYFDGEPISFDLALLGMGEDAHTISFFPNSSVIHVKDQWVVSLYLKEQDMYRISLTPTIVNGSAKIYFLVTGSSKASALKQNQK